MSEYLFPFSFAFLIVLILIPILRIIAFKYNFVDIPNERKIHKEPIPLLGGLGIFIGYIISIFIWIEDIKLNLIILASGMLIVGVGLFDDYYKTRKKDLSPFIKVLIQFITGLIIFSFGIRITGISSLFSYGMYFFTPGLSLLITLIWIIGLMNMINFLDGLDGLASGISIISSMTLFLIALVEQNHTIAMLSIILMGVCLAFLRYNFYPAKIFMGDTGSLFLGLMLAIISIEGTMKSATLFSIIIVVLAFGVPIFDTIIVFFNRWKNHKPLYIADKNHAHHRLLRRGYSQKQAVTLIYFISIIFSLISVILLFLFVI